jgi:hypothetical protein
MSIEKHPTIGMAVPTYSYLIDILEDFIDDPLKSFNIKNGVIKAKKKLEEYYPTTDGLVYIIGTGMYNLYYIYIYII